MICGADMSTGLDQIELRRFGPAFWLWPDKATQHVTFRLIWFPAVLMVAAGGWLILSNYRGGTAEGEPAPSAAAAAVNPAPPAVAETAAFDPATSEAIVPQAPTPLDKLKISSQSWRRGGLGSKALVTFTLRNNNDYAVKDVQIACAFARRDGSHLTDRTRTIPGEVNTRSRKTFAHLHVGFININAARAKCSLVSASRI